MHRHLVERAMAGDHDAFAELARVRIGRLYAIAVLILRDPGRAEDATQEALVAAWRDLSALRDPDRFDAWLRRLLVRACYREARRPGADPRSTSRAGDRAVRARRIARLADRDEIERGFRRLDPDQRAVIVLHYYVGLPLPEVADALGIPVGTAKSRLHRATPRHAFGPRGRRARRDPDRKGGRHEHERRRSPASPPGWSRSPPRASPSTCSTRCSADRADAPPARLADPREVDSRWRP